MAGRIRLLSSENAPLRTEPRGSVKDRLATGKWIVTDAGDHLDHEMEGLRGPAD